MHHLLPLLLILACSTPKPVEAGSPPSAAAQTDEGTKAAPPPGPGQAVAIFGMGCFWCGESDMEAQPGVIEVLSGYAGGPEQHPSYEQVSSHGTGHAESVYVIYDPAKTTYDKLLDGFWHGIDPFQAEGQFCDHGHQYRSVIFPLDNTQRAAAEASKAKIEAQLGKPVATTIEAPGTFWVAEDYHQDFYKKNPGHYQSYRTGCGRDATTEKIWGDQSNGHLHHAD